MEIAVAILIRRPKIDPLNLVPDKASGAEPARASGARHLEAKVRLDNLAALPFWLAVGFREVDAGA
ncbi:MAG TPA: hypothetical protein VMU65_15505 [Candidatus Saccharimonadales bacterium]|nr:hypothetical protein [Candidatus Saccharimonadales bacterium]